MKLHPTALFIGLVYLAVGIAFMLEALGYWALQVGDLRYIGPLALVVVGLGVVMGSLRAHTNR